MASGESVGPFQVTGTGPAYSSTTGTGPAYSSTTGTGPAYSSTTGTGPTYSNTTGTGPAYSSTTGTGPAYSSTTGTGPTYSSTTGTGPAYSSTTGRRVVLAVYSNAFWKQTQDCNYDKWNGQSSYDTTKISNMSHITNLPSRTSVSILFDNLE